MPGGSMYLFLESGALNIILFKNKLAAEAEYRYLFTINIYNLLFRYTII